MHFELQRHRSERCAAPVTCRRKGNRFIGHLADQSPSRNARSIEMSDDRRPVLLVLMSEGTNRCTLAVTADQLADLSLRQPALHRV